MEDSHVKAYGDVPPKGVTFFTKIPYTKIQFWSQKNLEDFIS